MLERAMECTIGPRPIEGEKAASPSPALLPEEVINRCSIFFKILIIKNVLNN